MINILNASYLKEGIKKNRTIYRYIKVLNFLKNSKWVKENYYKKKYPQILQFPITNKCNSKCVMCNVPGFDSKGELTLEEFKKIMNDNIFKDIHSVGINGGEPFLKPDLISFIDVLVKRKNLKYLNIISNGFLTDLILKKLEEIHTLCKKNDVNFHVSFSLDGYGEIHNVVRNTQNVFENVIKTINSIYDKPSKYCDSYDIGCTIVKQNVDYLVELDAFMQNKQIPIKYRLGIENKRLNNLENADLYSVIKDLDARQTALEFLFAKIFTSATIYEKFKYYALFDFLSESRARKLGCDWRNNGITLDSKGNIYYCAVNSPCLANLKKDKGEDAFFSAVSIKEKKKIIDCYCNECIHDYYGNPDLKHVLSFIKFMYKHHRWIGKYRDYI